MLRDALLAGFSLVLGAVGVILEPRLHASSWPWLEYAIFGAAWLAAGWNVVVAAGRNIVRGRPFDESLLMTIATLGAFAVHALEEAVGVMLFFKLGEMAQAAAVGRSRRSIRALLALRPDTARLRSNGGWTTVRPEDVPVGAEILVKPGERIPLDGTVVEGSALVNTAALTGEPVPRRAAPGPAPSRRERYPSTGRSSSGPTGPPTSRRRPGSSRWWKAPPGPRLPPSA